MVNNYNKLKIKYKLPELNKLKEMLEIELKADQDAVLLLQSIRNDISERLFDMTKILESILFTGEGSDAGLLYQENMIKNVSKEGVDVYKILNELHFAGLKLRFIHDRKKDADYIKRVFKIWPSLENGLAEFFEALENGWKELDIEKEMKPENYHG